MSQKKPKDVDRASVHRVVNAFGDVRYTIEPGDWESATGESVDDDVVVQVIPPGQWSSCEWDWDSTHEKWDTECGEAFQLMEGSPRDNGMRFCPYCGKRLDESH